MKERIRKYFNVYTNNPWGYVFVLYPLVVLSVFMIFPILYSLFLSFTNADIHTLRNFTQVEMIGFGNYVKMFTNDPIFWKSLINTFYFIVVGGPLVIAASLGSALLLNKAVIRAKGLFRTIYFLPVITTIVAVAVIWRLLYEPRFGLINWALSLMSIQGPDWLNNPLTAMPAIILMATWKNFGTNMIVLVAGLQAISRELYEAAEIDGADAFQQFRYITLPSLKPVLLIVVIMVTIGYLQYFAEPFIMTQGGPLNSTISLTMHIYNNAFKYFNLGYASAIAYILFGMIAILSFVQIRMFRSEN